MDAETIRTQLRDVHAQIQRVEAERDALINLATAYEAWLRIYDPKKGYQVPLAIAAEPTKKSKLRRSVTVSGTVSIRGAIRDVLMQARGAELHSSEIWRRVEAMGAKTDAPVPIDLVDLNMVSIRKRDPRFKKVGVRTFKFEEGSTVLPRGQTLVPAPVGARS